MCIPYVPMRLCGEKAVNIHQPDNIHHCYNIINLLVDTVLGYNPDCTKVENRDFEVNIGNLYHKIVEKTTHRFHTICSGHGQVFNSFFLMTF